MRASPTNIWYAGDIKLRDLNNDGFVNIGTNRVSDPGDRRIIGNKSPRYTYGINLGADWDNIFLSAFFEGVGKQDWYPSTEAEYFWGQYNRPYNNIPLWHLGNMWTPDNRMLICQGQCRGLHPMQQQGNLALPRQNIYRMLLI
jgi:hypothetical protein